MTRGVGRWYGTIVAFHAAGHRLVRATRSAM